jgi:hypothetical protein
MADEVQVANRRLDASENEALIRMARMGADAFGYTADLQIDRHLAQLLRLRSLGTSTTVGLAVR